MLIFDGSSGSFRNIKLRNRSINCAVCGDSPSITAPIDYIQFCGSNINDKAKSLALLDPSQRISAIEYDVLRKSSVPHVLIDVRDELQFKICSIKDSKSKFRFDFQMFH